MAGRGLLFHWTVTADTSLPAWVTAEMYNGKFKSQRGLTTCVLQSNVTAGRSGKVTNGFIKALLRAKMIATGCNFDGYGCNKDIGVAEMTLSGRYEGSDVGLGEVVCVSYDRSNGTVRASKGGQMYNVAKETSAPIFLAMWMFFCEDTGFLNAFDEFCKASDDDARRSYACLLADYAYQFTTGSSPKLPTCEPSQVNNLSATKMNTPALKPKNYMGKFQRFQVTNRAKARKGKATATPDTAALAGAYAFSKNTLTPEQEELVPKLDNKYVVNDTLLNICNHIKATTGRPRPVRNVLLRGEPGTGKSETYVGIAYACHLPLYTFAANAMTEPFDLFGQFVPVDENGEQTGPKVPLDQILNGMPSANDISMDPVFCYQTITGLYKADATATDCMSAMFNLAQKSIDINGGQQRFKFVPGQLVYALRDGGVWGFDEVTLPQNPGVVPALNPAMDSTQSITLPTGEIIHRHPDCIIVGTTNIDLEGCRRMNQAWQDRCQLIVDMDEPDDTELMERIKSMTGFDDATDGVVVDLDKFVRAYHEFKSIAKKKRLDDGTIGPRKLADWVMSTLVTKDPVMSARMTIIPGATADERGMAELIEKLGDIF